MHKRDVTRSQIKNAGCGQEKAVLQSKYKALRNKVTRDIRQEYRDFNNNLEANSYRDKISVYLQRHPRAGEDTHLTSTQELVKIHNMCKDISI